VKDNSKKTSGGFKDLLKEKCPWNLEGNHTTEQCYQLLSVRNMVPTLTSSKRRGLSLNGRC
jgi:hypothetical protein